MLRQHKLDRTCKRETGPLLQNFTREVKLRIVINMNCKNPISNVCAWLKSYFMPTWTYEPRTCRKIKQNQANRGKIGVCEMQTCCCSCVCVMKFLIHRSPVNIRSSWVEINKNREMWCMWIVNVWNVMYIHDKNSNSYIMKIGVTRKIWICAPTKKLLNKKNVS